MKIAIVEDEAVWRDKVQTIIEKYCSDKNISFQINSYLSDDRIDNRHVKTLITKIAEEWVMIDSRGFKENATFQRIQLFCFFYFRNSGCKGIHAVM